MFSGQVTALFYYLSKYIESLELVRVDGGEFQGGFMRKKVKSFFVLQQILKKKRREKNIF